MSSFDSMWKSSIPVFLNVKPVDSVPTILGCRAFPPNHTGVLHLRKLWDGTTPFALRQFLKIAN